MADRKSEYFLFSWTIKGLDSQDGPYILSPEFKAESLGNSEWRLDIYKNKSSIIFYLALLSFNEMSKNAVVSYRFELVNSKGTTVNISDNKSLVLRRGTTSPGYELTMNHDDELIIFNKLPRISSSIFENNLTVRCHMAYENNSVPLLSRDDAFINCEAETYIINKSNSYEWNLKFKNFEHWREKKRVTIGSIPIEIIFKYILEEIRIEISSNIEEDDLEHKVACTIVLNSASFNEVFRKTSLYLINSDNKTMRNAPSFSKQQLDKAQCFTRGEIKVKFCFTHEKSSWLKYYENEENNKIFGLKNIDSNPQFDTVSDSDCLSDLHKDLDKLFLDKTFADVKLRVDNEVILAHKGILAARSPVLRTMFGNHNRTGIAAGLLTLMNIQSEEYLDIPDIEAENFKLLLEYIYTGRISGMDEEKATSLLFVAIKFQVMPLEKKCLKFLMSVMTPRNACKLLLIADKENQEELKSFTVNYIIKNSATILSSREWLQLKKVNVPLAMEVLEKLSVANQLQVATSKEESTPGSSKDCQQQLQVHSPSANLRKIGSGDRSSRNGKQGISNYEKEGRRSENKLRIFEQSEVSRTLMVETEGRFNSFTNAGTAKIDRFQDGKPRFNIGRAVNETIIERHFTACKLFTK